MNRILISIALAAAAVLSTGCIVGTWGVKPEPIAGQADTFKFKMFPNSFAMAGDVVDKAMAKDLEAFRVDHGYAAYKVVWKDFQNVPTAFVYTVQFTR